MSNHLLERRRIRCLSALKVAQNDSDRPIGFALPPVIFYESAFPSAFLVDQLSVLTPMTKKSRFSFARALLALPVANLSVGIFQVTY